MGVPNTTTFSLQDVVTEINPTTDDLIDCFADADAVKFDPLYEGSKDSLLNFRNYNGLPPDTNTAFPLYYQIRGTNITGYTPQDVKCLEEIGGGGAAAGFTRKYYASAGFQVGTQLYDFAEDVLTESGTYYYGITGGAYDIVTLSVGVITAIIDPATLASC